MKKTLKYSLLLIFIASIILLIINVNQNTVTEEKIYFPFEKYSSIQVDGNFIYASIHSKDGDVYYDKLIKYNIKDKNYDVIFESEFDYPAMQNIMVNEKWVTWLDANMSLSKIRIYCMNKETQEKELVYKMEYPAENLDTPYLYKDYISWAGFDKNDVPKVFLYNIKDKQLSEVYTFECLDFYNIFLHVNNDKLLWTDNIDDKGYFFTLDLKNKKINKYLSDCRWPAHSEIVDNKIFFEHLDHISTWGGYNYAYFDILTGEEIVLGKDTKDIYRIRVSDKLVAIENNERNLEIYKPSNLKEPIMVIDKDEKINLEYFLSDGRLLYTVSGNEKELFLLDIR